MVKYTQIKVYDEPITEQTFLAEHLSLHRPCIIRKCTENLKIQKWSIDYIHEKCGDNEVFCRWQTDNAKYQSGTEYQVRKTTVNELRGLKIE